MAENLLTKRKRPATSQAGDGQGPRKGNNQAKRDFTHAKGAPKGNKELRGGKEQDRDKVKHSFAKRLNRLYNEVLMKTTDKVTKRKLINDILGLIGDGYSKVILKHDGCRVLQACLKYGDRAQREKILTSMFALDVAELIKGKYSHFLIQKCLKFMGKPQLEALLDAITEHLETFILSKEATQVINQIFTLHPHEKRLRQLLSHFNMDAPQPTAENLKKLLDPKRVDNIALKIVNKGTFDSPFGQALVRKAMRKMVPQERELVLDAIVEQIHQLPRTKPGALLCMDVVHFTDAKRRKTILKAVKGHVIETLQAAGVFGVALFLKIAKTVDDTVAVSKSVLTELLERGEDTLKDPYAQQLILGIFDDKEPLVREYFADAPSEKTSKKSDDQRRQELIANLSPGLLGLFNQSLTAELLGDMTICKMLYAVIKENIGNENATSDVVTLLQNILEATRKDFNEKINATRNVEELAEKLLVANQSTHRLVKGIVKLLGGTDIARNEQLSEFFESLFMFVDQNIGILAQTRAAFIILAFIEENTSYRDQIIQSLKTGLRNLPMNKPGLSLLQPYLQE